MGRMIGADALSAHPTLGAGSDFGRQGGAFPLRLRGEKLIRLRRSSRQRVASNSAVTITAKEVCGGNGVELSVHNEGTPIPPNMIPKLFVSFYRLDARDADTQPANLGLGLYISREIVAAHGGTIEVRSSAEEGTTFTVRLPSR